MLPVPMANMLPRIQLIAKPVLLPVVERTMNLPPVPPLQIEFVRPVPRPVLIVGQIKVTQTTKGMKSLPVPRQPIGFVALAVPIIRIIAQDWVIKTMVSR